MGDLGRGLLAGLQTAVSLTALQVQLISLGQDALDMPVAKVLLQRPNKALAQTGLSPA